jgi:hypothetical protein
MNLLVYLQEFNNEDTEADFESQVNLQEPKCELVCFCGFLQRGCDESSVRTAALHQTSKKWTYAPSLFERASTALVQLSKKKKKREKERSFCWRHLGKGAGKSVNGAGFAAKHENMQPNGRKRMRKNVKMQRKTEREGRNNNPRYSEKVPA